MAELEHKLAELTQENQQLRAQIAGHQQTTKLLLEERDLLRTLIDIFPDTIYVKDRDGHFTLVNRALLKQFSLSEFRDVIGKNDFDFIRPELAEKFRVDDERIVQTGHILVGKEEMNQSQGQLRWSMTTKVPLRDSEGNIMGIVGISRDITERKHAETILQQAHDELERRVAERTLALSRANADLEAEIVERRRAEEQLSYHAGLLQNVSDAIISANMDFKIQSWNRAAEAIYGLTEAEVLGKHISEVLSINIFKNDDSDIRQHLIQYGSWRGEVNHVRKDGTVQYILSYLSLIRDADGNPSGMVSVDRDITDRKLAELAEREQRILADALRDIASTLNSTLNLNEVLERILIQVQRVLPHDSASIMLIEDNVARVVHSRGLIERGISPETLADYRFPLADYKNLRMMMETGQPYLVTNTWNEEQWRPVSETSWIRSSLGAPILVEDRVIGYIHLDSAVAKAFAEEDSRKLLAFANQAAVAMHNARLYYAIRRHADELEVRVAERTSELERQRAQLLTILDAMTEGVAGIMYDKSGQPALRYINRAFGIMLGYGADEWDMMHLPVADASEEEIVKIVHDYSQAMLTDGFWREELTLLCKDGTQLEASIAVNWVNDPDGTVIGEVSVIRDISQEKVLEEQRSRFVANASHELRTPITNVLTRLYLLRKQPERLNEHLDILEHVSLRMRNLVEDLLEYSRFERGVIPLNPVIIDLGALIMDVIRIQKAEADKKHIQVNYSLPPSPLRVLADPDRMTQVFTNLVTNAINYTPEKGAVEVDFVVKPRSDPRPPQVAVRSSGHRSWNPARVPALHF